LAQRQFFVARTKVSWLQLLTVQIQGTMRTDKRAKVTL